tara:strand:+ start:2242 stop:3633 length:1392 start_codon:yes stop_codon:yes gene_type:complete
MLSFQSNRREFLRMGVAGLGTAALEAAADDGSQRGAGWGRARSVLIVFTGGGQSQLEMWDPKPDAPEVVRGEFAAIRTPVPGTFLGEHTPRVAALADRYAILRSMSHEDLDHGSATYLALTGHYHRVRSGNPSVSPTDKPTFGSLLARVRPTSNFAHTAVHLNAPLFSPREPAPGQFAGLLGRDYEPLQVGGSLGDRIAMPGLTDQPGLPPVRVAARQKLLTAIDTYRKRLVANRHFDNKDTLYQQAWRMLANPACRQAFDLSQEPTALRDRYGRNRSGQSCLLARRLIEARVPLVTVMWNHNARGQDTAPEETDEYGWDTHNDIFMALRKHLLPRFDLSFSALLEDMEDRGLLDTTLVVCMGEFGRAPLVAREKSFAGTSPGRKHWAAAYSIVLAGAGVRPGTVYGATDRLAAYPRTEPVTPWDIGATIFHALGIDPHTTFTDSLGRPFQLTEGRPVTGLFG